MFSIHGLNLGPSKLEAAEQRYAVYPNADPDASNVIAERLAHAATAARVLTYAELGRGITFRLPMIHGGRPHVIDPVEGIVLSADRDLLNEFLAFLTVQSYKHAKVFACALLVDGRASEPAKLFIRLAGELGIHHSANRDRDTLFWVHELKKLHAWFKARG
jgi:hypothetical protein